MHSGLVQRSKDIRDGMECSQVIEVEELFFVIFDLSFVGIIGPRGRGRGTRERKKAHVEIEASMEGWEKGLGGLHCRFIYTFVLNIR